MSWSTPFAARCWDPADSRRSGTPDKVLARRMPAARLRTASNSWCICRWNILRNTLPSIHTECRPSSIRSRSSRWPTGKSVSAAHPSSHNPIGMIPCCWSSTHSPPSSSIDCRSQSPSAHLRHLHRLRSWKRKFLAAPAPTRRPAIAADKRCRSTQTEPRQMARPSAATRR